MKWLSNNAVYEGIVPPVGRCNDYVKIYLLYNTSYQVIIFNITQGYTLFDIVETTFFNIMNVIIH